MQYQVETMHGRAGKKASLVRVCHKCGARIFADAPQGLCAACLLEVGLQPPLNNSDEAFDASMDRVRRALLDFGDYELLEEIGRGGQGIVYRARQKSLNRIVALKVIGLGFWATEAHIKRFRLEAEAAASLDHPGIVPIYEVGERDGSCYFSMKFVEGGQLDGVAQREPISIRRAVELIAKLARTVHYAHQRGILHRDIKPGNILLDTDGEPHLTDFGLARLVETESTVTRTMEVLGTPSYMAPEEAAGQTAHITSGTDIYGLGAVLYQLLTGQPPFAGGTTFETIRLVLEAEPRRPRLWNSKVDRDLETICLTCLQKDPPRRYASALALAEDLERWLRHEPIRARPAGIFTRGGKWIRRNPTLAVLVPAFLGLAVVVGMMLWKDRNIPPTTGIAVLPFENLGGNKENASFTDGIQDDILTKLAKVADLKVISRTSVMQYRGVRNTRKIGQALGVSHVLEGSVRNAGDRIRLNAQLIDTRNDTHVWAEQYDGDLADIFAIQSEIAQKIASQLSAKMSREEKIAIEKKPTQDMEAYDLYLRGKELMHSTSTMEADSLDKFSKAAILLEKAVERDPNFALAYCLLTEAQLNRYWRTEAVPGAVEKADAALQAARRLAPEAGETHLAEAAFFYWGHRDYDHALEVLEKAAHSLPNSADVLRLTANVERRLGRWSEALRHGARAVELDPKDWWARESLISTYLLMRRYAEAHQSADRAITDLPEKANYFRLKKGEAALSNGNLQQARADLAGLSLNSDTRFHLWIVPFLDRDYAEAYRILAAAERSGPSPPRGDRYPVPYQEGLTARAAGDVERAKSAFTAARRVYIASLSDKPNGASDFTAAIPPETQAALTSYFPEMLSQVAVVDAALGRKEEAVREARRAVELRPISRDAVEGPEVATNLALVYAWVGERDRAVEQLSLLAKGAGGPSYGELKLDPIWDELRDDPRFAQILADAAAPIPIK